MAGKPTLNRPEHAPAGGVDRYHEIDHDAGAIENAFADLFLEAHDDAPDRVVPDLDATDVPLHGQQEGRFFHGYYDNYCYMPLYIFCGRHLLASKLRRSNIDAAAGSVDEVARIVGGLREHWPEVEVLLRGDSGFADFPWTTRGSRSRTRRVVARAEWTHGKANPRFVVTSLDADARDARALHENLCRRRGDGENRIEECRLDPFADRTSTRTMRANQLRPWFALIACVLLCALRRIGLPHTRFAAATCATIPLKPLEIGARVTTGVRRLEVAMTSARPRRRERALAHERPSSAAA